MISTKGKFYLHHTFFKVFNNHNHLIEHYGVAHKMSYEIFKTFDQSKINERDKEFKEKLNAATPTECEFCGVTFVHNGKRSFNNMWMHYIESHKDIFTFVTEEICSRVYNQFCSCFYLLWKPKTPPKC